MDNKKMLELFDRYEEKFGEAPPTYGYVYKDMEKEIAEAIENDKPIEFEIKDDLIY